MANFQTSLKAGQAGESAIATWLRKRGNGVIPAYDKIFDTGKGPQVFLPSTELIAPDFLVFNDTGTLWIEAKTKSAFTWHRLTHRWVTGIDLKHYLHYQEIDKQTPWRAWLLFLHKAGNTAKDSPPGCPTGLFGNSLKYLNKHENHRHENWGSSGMVYWDVSHLLKFNTL